MEYFLRDTRIFWVSLLAFIVPLSYYFTVWSLYGEDPSKGHIMPIYTPPGGLSPASLSYIMEMGYDKKAFTATVVNLAVKRYLTITENAEHEFAVEKTPKANRSPEKPLPGERKVFDILLGSRQSLALKQTNHQSVKSARDALKNHLEKEYRLKYFITNTKWLVPGIGLSLLSFFFLFFLFGTSAEFLFFLLHFLVWTPVLILLLGRMFAGAWGQFFRTWKAKHACGAILLTPHTMMLVAVIPILLGMMWKTEWALTLFIIPLVALNALYYYLLKAPTPPGRKLMDRIEGYRLFLKATEEDRLKMLTPPKRTPELFEKNLPYAIALGVEQPWAEQFESQLDSSSLNESTRFWYRSSAFDGAAFGSSALAGALSAPLAGAISSASVSPGSSGGGGFSSSGGGSSGGGGGGGGGGGW